MTEKITITADLPKHPIGTHFEYRRNQSVRVAEIVGYEILHDTHSGKTSVQYRIAYDFIGQTITATVSPVTVARGLACSSCGMATCSCKVEP